MIKAGLLLIAVSVIFVYVPSAIRSFFGEPVYHIPGFAFLVIAGFINWQIVKILVRNEKVVEDE